MAEIVRFLRSRDYKLIKELGQGACGKTVLLADDQIDQQFVCKKYSPNDESEREALFKNFVRLGFGKQVNTSLDFDKSITLNWWCATPDEFRLSRYDFTTEVYFAGKLFAQLIQANNISQFKYTDALRRMCEPDPNRRIKSFAEIDRAIRSEQITETDFSAGGD